MSCFLGQEESCFVPQRSHWVSQIVDPLSSWGDIFVDRLSSRNTKHNTFGKSSNYTLVRQSIHKYITVLLFSKSLSCQFCIAWRRTSIFCAQDRVRKENLPVSNCIPVGMRWGVKESERVIFVHSLCDDGFLPRSVPYQWAFSLARNSCMCGKVSIYKLAQCYYCSDLQLQPIVE